MSYPRGNEYDNRDNYQDHYPVRHDALLLVGVPGFEPGTFRSQSEGSTRLSYTLLV